MSKQSPPDGPSSQPPQSQPPDAFFNSSHSSKPPLQSLGFELTELSDFYQITMPLTFGITQAQYDQTPSFQTIPPGLHRTIALDLRVLTSQDPSSQPLTSPDLLFPNHDTQRLALHALTDYWARIIAQHANHELSAMVNSLRLRSKAD